MNWINGDTKVNNVYRRSKIQRCLSFAKPYLDVMYTRFNDLFGDIVDFSDSVSSIKWYPIKFPMDKGGSLETPKIEGSGQYDIIVFDIPDSSSYLYLGEYYVKPFYNDFRDYNDSTKIKVFLPFCGFVDIDPIDCMGRWLQFRLNVDYATGNATYIIGDTHDSIFNVAKEIGTNLVVDTSSRGLSPYVDTLTRVISTINCNISIDIPIGSTNANDIMRNALLNSVKIAGSAALSYLTKNPTPIVSTTMSTKTYNVKSRGKYRGAKLLPSKVGTETTESTRVQERAVDKSYIGINAFEESMNLLNSNISSSQTDRPNNCIDMVNLAHNIHVVRYLTRYVGNSYDDDDMSMDGNYYGYEYRHTFGLPLDDFRTLGDVSGYTKVGEIHFESSLDDSANIDQATQYEVDLLVSKLKEGVVL